jgi:hypothetical protein
LKITEYGPAVSAVVQPKDTGYSEFSTVAPGMYVLSFKAVSLAFSRPEAKASGDGLQNPHRV